MGACMYLRPFFTLTTVKYSMEVLNGAQETETCGAAARAATAPLSATLQGLVGCYSELFLACLLRNIFSLNLLQIFKCRNVAVLTVALNRSMSMTGLAVLTVLGE